MHTQQIQAETANELGDSARRARRRPNQLRPRPAPHLFRKKNGKQDVPVAGDSCILSVDWAPPTKRHRQHPLTCLANLGV